MPTDDRLGLRAGAAQYLDVSPWTLCYLRTEGREPLGLRAGKHRTCDWHDVRNWHNANTSKPARGNR